MTVCYHDERETGRTEHSRGKRNTENMQTVSSHYPNNLNQQSRKVAVTAILLFALAGLLSGFAVGAFVHPKSHSGTGTGSGSTGTKTTPVVHNTPTQGTTAVAEYVNLNEP